MGVVAVTAKTSDFETAPPYGVDAPADTGSFVSRLRNRTDRLSAFAVVSVVIAVGFALLAIYPIGKVLSQLFIVDGTLSFGLLGRIISEPGVLLLLRNTTLLVLGGGIVAVVFGAILAWLVVRTDARIPFISHLLPLLPFLLPAIVGIIGWTVLLAPGSGFLNVFFRWILSFVGLELTEGPIDIYSWGGLIFVYGLYMMPFTFLLVAAGLEQMDSQLEEQARVSGAGLLKTLWTVTIPSVGAHLGAAMLLTIWFGFAFFSGPAILGTRAKIPVLSVRIVDLLTFTFPPQTGVAVGLSGFMLVAVAVAWYMQTRLLRGSRFATVGGRGKASTIELGRWRWLGKSVVIGYVVMTCVLPVLALLWLAVRGFWSAELTLEGLSLNQFRDVLFRDPFTSRALMNSAQLAVVGATIGMLCAAIIARYVQTSTTWAGRWIDALVKVSAPVPSVVLAVGFLLAFGGPPFYLIGTFLMMLGAYVTHFIPQATVSADAAAAQVGKELSEASHISGGGDARTFFRISLPLMLPGLMAGWALLFLWMLGEFNASVILASVSNPVIGFQIYSLYQQGFYGRLAALSIVLLAVNAIVVSLVFVLGRRARIGATAARSAR